MRKRCSRSDCWLGGLEEIWRIARSIICEETFNSSVKESIISIIGRVSDSFIMNRQVRWVRSR